MPGLHCLNSQTTWTLSSGPIARVQGRKGRRQGLTPPSGQHRTESKKKNMNGSVKRAVPIPSQAPTPCNLSRQAFKPESSSPKTSKDTGPGEAPPGGWSEGQSRVHSQGWQEERGTRSQGNQGTPCFLKATRTGRHTGPVYLFLQQPEHKENENKENTQSPASPGAG